MLKKNKVLVLAYEFTKAAIPQFLLEDSESRFFPESEELLKWTAKHAHSYKKIILFTDFGIKEYVYLTKIKKLVVGMASEKYSAEYAAAHNNANLLIIPLKFTASENLKEIINLFLHTEFEIRHQYRIDMLNEIKVKYE